MPDPRELSAEQVRRVFDAERLDFASTGELPRLEDVIGQDRAVRALNFGIGIDDPGYHIFAIGPIGTGKLTTISKMLRRRAETRDRPDDWCYVNDFADPERPTAIALPAGMGSELADDFDRMVEELATEVPRVFESEHYQKESERVQERFRERQHVSMQALRNEVESESFVLVQTPGGILLAPAENGEVISPDRFEKLDDERKHALEEVQAKLQRRLRETMREGQTIQREARDRIRELDRQAVGFAVENLLHEIREKYGEHPAVLEFVAAVQADIEGRADEIKKARQADESADQGPMAMLGGGGPPSFDSYRVNLIVDNAALGGAPVVLERNPTPHKLVGRVEHEARFGALVTDFRMIKAGALHAANGGYLLVEAWDVLSRPFAWETLKRALKDRELKIETMAEEYRAVVTRTLQPAPIPFTGKVVLVGDARVHHLLLSLDPEFRELFKVKADFAVDTPWDDDTALRYARFIGTLCHDEDLRQFTPSGVARVLEQAARMAGEQSKLATMFGDIVDLLREASYWAGESGHALVDDSDVRRAVQEKIDRSNRIEERLRDLIARGTLMIDTDGEAVGQVNGIAVLSTGDYAFGKPSRITARTWVGSRGVVNIDREAKLGGRLHNKGAMILAGYLGGRYAGAIPLAVSGSVTFEQLYEEVEGDSASSAELYALLSSLADLPIRQGFAVTGSVNQHGRIQAIGGVNEKIEGFFDVCRAVGPTGTQGVLIPAANVPNLMLREDVAAAVERGEFHVYPVETVDEGIAILTGVEAGSAAPDGTFPEGSVNHRVADRLLRLALASKSFGRKDDRGDAGAERDGEGEGGAASPGMPGGPNA